MTLWSQIAPWKKQADVLLTGFLAALPGEKEGHFLIGAGISGYLGITKRQEFTQIYSYY